MNKNEIISKGEYSDLNYISPSYINIKNPKYIEIDSLYYSGILIVDYSRENSNLILKNILESKYNYNISIFYEKKNSSKIIRELTYNIGNVGADLKEKNYNNELIDIASYTYSDAKYIRKEIQVNNEDFYYIYIYLITYSDDKKKLEKNINFIEGILNSSGLQTKKSFCRQEQVFKSSLPFAQNNNDIKKITKRNILTSGLIGTYPFISSNIFDENGIYFGINQKNNSLIFIDKYNNNKYKNSNICIFGSSGARKIIFFKDNDFKK